MFSSMFFSGLALNILCDNKRVYVIFKFVGLNACKMVQKRVYLDIVWFIIVYFSCDFKLFLA